MLRLNVNRFVACCSLIFMLTSCITFMPPHSIKKNFNICYDGKPTGIEILLKVDGYYTMKYFDYNWRYSYLYKDSLPKTYSRVINFIFYRDGSIVYDLFDYNDVEQTFKKIQSGIKAKHEFERLANWGKYSIQGDTIKIQWINHPAPLAATWMGSEVAYKIINDTTLKFIYEKHLDQYSEKMYQQYHKEWPEIRFDAKFTPTQNRPDSVSWLKRRRFFYCK